MAGTHLSVHVVEGLEVDPLQAVSVAVHLAAVATFRLPRFLQSKNFLQKTGFKGTLEMVPMLEIKKEGCRVTVNLSIG